MAHSFLCTRSLVFAQRSLKSSVIRRFPSLRSFIHSYSLSQQQSLLLLSRSSGRRQAPFRLGTSSAAAIVTSEYRVEIPEISLSDFVLSKFSEYGDDIAMVSYREVTKDKHKLI